MNTLKYFKKDFYERIGGLKRFRGKKVLDLGCGDGEDALEISKFAKSVTGIDIEKNDLWKKRRNQNLRFKIAPAEKLPFAENTFDALFLKDVIHHVKDIEKTLKEIKRVTTKDAVIILIEGNRYNPLFYIHMTRILGHEHLSQKDFKQLITKYFPKARFIHFESHFVPWLNEKQFKMLIAFEKFIEKFSWINGILSYNAALIN